MSKYKHTVTLTLKDPMAEFDSLISHIKKGKLIIVDKDGNVINKNDNNRDTRQRV